MELGTWLKLLESGSPMLPALILGAMYWYERKDRIRLQEGRDQLLERVLTALNESSMVLREWRRMLGG